MPEASPPALRPGAPPSATRNPEIPRSRSASLPAGEAERMMLAYQGGDRAAFRALFEHYAPLVLRLGQRHLGNEDDARELVQQTFLKLHGARYDFREGERLHPWLMTIVMNLVRDRWRRRKRKPTAPLEQEPPAPDHGGASAEVEARQRAATLHLAMAKLTTRQREVVELHWFQDHTFPEVARIVGSTEGAVRVQAHRAYGVLRGYLEEDDG